jgi:hypothetical protein
MRNVLRAKVDILTFIQEHIGDVDLSVVDKFGVRECRDASRRSCTSSMMLVKGIRRFFPALLWQFPFALLRSSKRSCCFTSAFLCYDQL